MVIKGPFFSQENVEKGFKNVLEESQKLTDKIKEEGKDIPENAEKIFKRLYEDTWATITNVSNQINNAGKKD